MLYLCLKFGDLLFYYITNHFFTIYSGTTQLMLLKLLSLNAHFLVCLRYVRPTLYRQRLSFVNIGLVFVFEIVTLETFFTKILLD